MYLQHILLVPLRLTAAALVTGSGTTVLIISDKEMDDIIRIVKSLEESGLLIKDMTKTIKK